jgi:serine/threonine-protein kinase
MALTGRVWTAGKTLLLIAGLAATFVLFAAASIRVALKLREVTVPDLTGRTTGDATAAAGRLGLALRVDDAQRPDARINRGRVVAQEPAAGVVARRPRSIKVWLSAGPPGSALPSLVGETERTALLRVAQDGLAVDTTSEIYSDAYPSDVIVAQQPPAKAPSSRVSLLVNRGTRGVAFVMPDLIGVSGDRAAEILRQSSLRVAVVASTPYPGLVGGIVVRQSPQAGFRTGGGETISLEVSR